MSIKLISFYAMLTFFISYVPSLVSDVVVGSVNKWF